MWKTLVIPLSSVDRNQWESFVKFWKGGSPFQQITTNWSVTGWPWTRTKRSRNTMSRTATRSTCIKTRNDFLYLLHHVSHVSFKPQGTLSVFPDLVDVLGQSPQALPDFPRSAAAESDEWAFPEHKDELFLDEQAAAVGHRWRLRYRDQDDRYLFSCIPKVSLDSFVIFWLKTLCYIDLSFID